MKRGAAWRRARQAAQAAAFALFVLLAFLTYRGVEFILPVDLFFRLDPLVGVTAMLASRAVAVILLLSLLLLALGFVFGRAWCGWICPLGTLLDWFSPRVLGRAEPHPKWRGVKYVLLIAALAAALLGNLSLLILDPITLVNRALASAVLPAVNVVVVALEGLLVPFEPLNPLIAWIEGATRGTLLPATQTHYELGWLMAGVLAGVVALNWVVPRFWCRYLCPLGGVYALTARVSLVKPNTVVDCNHCAACMRVCPTGAITVTKKGFQVDPAECVVCMDCVTQCPESVIAFRAGASAAAVPTYDLSRRRVVGSAALGVAAVSLFRTAPAARRDDPWLLRPPGARENEFLTKCVRCAQCVKVCPTGGLQPSWAEAGIEGLWSPVLAPRLGYCDYSCNACGGVCPTGAIPLLSLEAKRLKVIGQAYIDTNRCIPWASYRQCVVCEEMCPLPDKAIKLQEVEVATPEGQLVQLRRPVVRHDVCIGCGICEYQCPLTGPSAIRVYAPAALPALPPTG